MAQLAGRLGLNRFDADEYYRQALEAYRKGRLDAAIHAISDALALLPSNAEYLAARGLFYLEDDNRDAARADFERALRLNRTEMLAHYGLGVLAYRAGQLDAAEGHFAEAYRADPQRPETLYHLAILYHRRDRNDAARRLMQAALERYDTADKRRADAQRWIREFDKILAASEPKPLSNPTAEQKKLL